MQLILDTETTGLDENAEIIEISLVDYKTETVVFTSLVKPVSPVPGEATAIHGITNDMLEDAPSFKQLGLYLAHILNGSHLHIYNAEFDLRLLAQTSAINCFTCDFEKLPAVVNCVMNDYAAKYGKGDEKHHAKRQSLINACKQQSIDCSDLTAHRASDDCIMTARLLKVMASDNFVKYES